MLISHHLRPALLFSVVIVLMAALACGSAAQPNATTSGPPDPVPATNSGQGHNGDPGPGVQDETPADEVRINLPIIQRATTLTRGDLQVSQGDTVRLIFEADEEGEVHLHGYDLAAPVSPGHPGELAFVADTAGAFGINFHVFDGGNKANGDANGHGGMSHESLVSETPVSVSVVAHAEDSGAVNVHIMAEGWRWAPEEVNQEYTPGAGHAHIYVDGVKINRVYGPYYHLTGLEPGRREIRVTLNANSHADLLLNDQPVAATTVVMVPKPSDSHSHHQVEAVSAQSAMAVAMSLHEDALGGYNLQVIPSGFSFSGANVNQDHVVGSAEGHVHVYVDGVKITRSYEPWLKMEALPPGERVISVSLFTNDHRPYEWNGAPVEASINVHVKGEGGEQMAHSSHTGSDGHSNHHHGAADGREVVAEVHLGNLEVYP